MSPQVLVDRTLCCSLFFFFFLRCFFHINNFLCITVWHIYNKYNQTVVCIHAGFLTWYNLYHVRNTYIMSETRHGYKLLFDCIYCIYVIQWYIESCKMLYIWKKVDVKKKEKKGSNIGSCPQVPVKWSRHYVEIRQGQRCNHICVTGTCY